MSIYYKLDENGNPQPMGHDLSAWLKEMRKNRRVAFDEVGVSTVSTVFCGVDRSLGRGPPLVFETMVFGGVLDGSEQLYSTREQALAGHKQLVQRAKEQDRRAENAVDMSQG